MTEPLHQIAKIVSNAEQVARAAGHQMTTAHLLLVLFATPCGARDLLLEAGADHLRLAQTYRTMRNRSEPAGLVDDVLERAEMLASRTDANNADTTMLLASLLRVRSSAATALATEAGLDAATLRVRAIAAVTAGADRGGPVPPRFPALPSRQPSRPGGLRAFSPNEPPPARALPVDASLSEPRRGRRPRRDSDELARQANSLWRGGASETGFSGPTRSSTTIQLATTATLSSSSGLLPSSAGLGATGAADAGLASATQRFLAVADDTLPPGALPGDEMSLGVESPSAVLAAVSPPPTSAVVPVGVVARPLAHAPAHGIGQDDFELDASVYPNLVRYGRNLTAEAIRGDVQPLIGREDLVDAVIDVLLMRQVNNPCLVGEAGVGKTALVEGLAARIAGNQRRYGRLGSAVIIEIQVSNLLAGTAMRGAFAERMKALRDEVAAADGRVLIFMDEIHNLMGAGAGDGPLDAANDLKTALSRGKFPLIGATTRAEYRRFIEADPAMERRLQIIDVPEPSPEEAIAILTGIAPTYEEHHGVPFSHDAIVSAVELSQRFLPDRALPAKAIAVLDRAGAQARRHERTIVGRADIARAVATLGNIGIDQLLDDERGRLRELDAELDRVVFGQSEATQRIARRIARNQLGLGGERPAASFVFAGPPGCGKSLAAQALGKVLFLRPEAVVSLDMADFSEAHTVSRLIGSPPGYVGHQQPGLLAEAMHRRPYRVLVLEHIDRAAPEVLAIVQQIVDSGRVVDSQGRTIEFRHAVVVCTTTLAPEMFGLGRRSIGFGSQVASARVEDVAVRNAVRRSIGPLVDHVDEIVSFLPLQTDALVAVASGQLEKLAAAVLRDRLIRIEFSPQLAAQLAADEADGELGARGLRQRIAQRVEEPVGSALLDGVLRAGMRVRVDWIDGQLAMRQDQATAPTQTDPRERP